MGISNSAALVSKRARVIAFYLPQFHPVPENDLWWGKGFTEWTNVAKAKPLFKGHEQPILPGELGFYDLRLEDVRLQQANLARAAGVEGFCYWHYWFGKGKRILERVSEEVISSHKPDFPFCLGWANESWTGRWHGLNNRVLMEQTYPGKEDEERHFYALLPAFSDPRYIEIQGRKLFLIYRPELIPSLSSFTSHWNKLASKNGLENFYFVSVNDMHDLKSQPELEGVIPRHIHDVIRRQQKYSARNFAYAFLKSIGLGSDFQSLSANISGKFPMRTSYSRFLNEWTKTSVDERTFPCLIPNWDNTARSGRGGYVLEGSNPHLFLEMIEWAIKSVEHRPNQERLVFLKSWNEWAEGNYVEPDAKFGTQYLDALASRIFHA